MFWIRGVGASFDRVRDIANALVDSNGFRSRRISVEQSSLCVRALDFPRNAMFFAVSLLFWAVLMRVLARCCTSVLGMRLDVGCIFTWRMRFKRPCLTKRLRAFLWFE